MLGGYLEFFMKPDLASTYLGLKRELEELIQNKVSGSLFFSQRQKLTCVLCKHQNWKIDLSGLCLTTKQ